MANETEATQQPQPQTNPNRDRLARLKLGALARIAADVAAGIALERVAAGVSHRVAAAHLAASDGTSVMLDLATVANTTDHKRVKAISKEHAERAESRMRVAKSIAAAGAGGASNG